MVTRIISIFLSFSILSGMFFSVSASEKLKTAEEYDSLYFNIAKMATDVKLDATKFDGTSGVLSTDVKTVLSDGIKTRPSASYSICDNDTKTAALTYTFAAPQEFNKLVIYAWGRNMREFTLYGSNDSVNWTPFYEYNKMGESYIYCYFPTQSWQYLKIDMHRLATQHEASYRGVNVTEIEIYNVTEPEYYRLNDAIKRAEAFFSEMKNDGKPYFKDRIDALYEAVSESRLALTDKSLKQEEIEACVIDINNALFQVKFSLDYPREEYEKLIYNWRDDMTCSNVEFSDVQKNSLESTVAYAEKLWKTMKKDGTSVLWENVGSIEEAMAVRSEQPMGNIAGYLRSMSIAATHKYSRLCGNPELIKSIEYAMDIFSTYWITEEAEWYATNVWNSLCGNYIRIGDTALYMYGLIDENIMEKFCKVGLANLKADYMQFTGVNKLDCSVGGAKLGAVLGYDYYIDNLMESLEAELVIKDIPAGSNEQASMNNGYYTDGSYVFHDWYALTGSYGIKGYSYYPQILGMLNGTKWFRSEKEIKSFLGELTFNAYIPILVNDGIMGMTTGRNITSLNNEQNLGSVAITGLCDVGYVLDEPMKTTILSYLKTFITNSGSEKWKTWASNNKVWQLMLDDSIPLVENPVLSKVYNYSERVVHRRDNFILGLSMSSERIRHYEFANTMNSKGFFQGSGMTYFYDDDYRQYSDGYFWIVNSRRLPGVTAISKDMPYEFNHHLAENSFAGGTTVNGLYSSAGYITHQSGTDLTANKSYFMFDDEIVMIGSDINTTNRGGRVETTVDQRRVKDKTADDISVNGELIKAEEIDEKLVKDVKTAHVKGRTDKSEFGYYFPTPTEIYVDKKYKTGYASAVVDTSNPAFVDSSIKGTMATLYIDHGLRPVNKGYAYAVLPGKTSKETVGYSENPDIEVISQNNGIHAVFEKNTGVLGLNVFEKKSASAMGLCVDNISLSMLQDKDGRLTYSVCDPNLNADYILNVEIDREALSLVSCNDRIKVKQMSPEIILEVDLNKSYGKSLEVTFECKADVNRQDVDINEVFTDISGHWAENAISDLYIKGFINGTGNRRFNPDRPITRAEFAYLYASVKGIGKYTYRNEFLDVHPSDYFADASKNVDKMGVLKAKNRYFNPHNDVTVQEFMSVFPELKNEKSINLDDGISRAEVVFALSESK